MMAAERDAIPKHLRGFLLCLPGCGRPLQGVSDRDSDELPPIVLDRRAMLRVDILSMYIYMYIYTSVYIHVFIFYLYIVDTTGFLM